MRGEQDNLLCICELSHTGSNVVVEVLDLRSFNLSCGVHVTEYHLSSRIMVEVQSLKDNSITGLVS